MNCLACKVLQEYCHAYVVFLEACVSQMNMIPCKSVIVSQIVTKLESADIVQASLTSCMLTSVWKNIRL